MYKKVMIKIFIIYFTFSCNVQDNYNDIKGNWYNYAYEKGEMETYVETLITDTNFYLYDENVNLRPNLEYKIENNQLFYITGTNKEHAGKIKIIDKNTISLHDGKIILKRVSKGLTLEDYLFNNKSEDVYWTSFIERKSEWERLKK